MSIRYCPGTTGAKADPVGWVEAIHDQFFVDPVPTSTMIPRHACCSTGCHCPLTLRRICQGAVHERETGSWSAFRRAKCTVSPTAYVVRSTVSVTPGRTTVTARATPRTTMKGAVKVAIVAATFVAMGNRIRAGSECIFRRRAGVGVRKREKGSCRSRVYRAPRGANQGGPWDDAPGQRLAARSDPAEAREKPRES